MYEMTQRQMFGLALRMLGNRQTAEDVLQESYVAAFDKIKQLKAAESFQSWLKRIVFTNCLRLVKRNIVYMALPDEVADSSYHDEERWWEGIGMDAIQEAIRMLPEGCRVVFNLYAIEDLSHQEIATMLDISESTSKTQYRRAKLLLKENLLKKATI